MLQHLPLLGPIPSQNLPVTLSSVRWSHSQPSSSGPSLSLRAAWGRGLIQPITLGGSHIAQGRTVPRLAQRALKKSQHVGVQGALDQNMPKS